MALPADTALETAIATIEQALTEDMTLQNTRSAIASWKEVLGFIEKGARHHAAVDDHDAQTRVTIVEHNRPRIQSCLDFLEAAAEHAAIDEDGEFDGRYVDDRGSRTEFGSRHARDG